MYSETAGVREISAPEWRRQGFPSEESSGKATWRDLLMRLAVKQERGEEAGEDEDRRQIDAVIDIHRPGAAICLPGDTWGRSGDMKDNTSHQENLF